MLHAHTHTHTHKWREVRPFWGGGLGSAELVLTQVEGEVDRSGVLDAVVHGLALPPRGLLVPVEVRQEAGAVAQVRRRRVAVVAGARGAGLHAVVFGRGAARVGRHRGAIEGHVLEPGQAAARRAVLVHARVHGGAGEEEVAVGMQKKEQREKRAHGKVCFHVYKTLLITHTHTHTHTFTVMHSDAKTPTHARP